MIVVVEMEIETEDYGGKEFMEEIVILLNNIDPDAKLTRFKMRQKGPTSISDYRTIDWER